MRAFEDPEVRDLLSAIVDAEGREEGRRFIVTIETTSGRSVTGQVVSTEQAQLELVDDQAEQVDWEDIVAVRVHSE